MKIILTFLLFSLTLCLAQNNELTFENISAFQGLSSARAKTIFQDSEGYMWFGTMDGGLNRYDGYSFTVFKNEPDNPNSIINDVIYGLDESKDGRLWIPTAGGISIYDPKENSFENYNMYDQFEEVSKFGYSHVYAVLVDSRERIWFGHSHIGIISYNRENDTFINVTENMLKSNNYSAITISDFVEDEHGTIWAASSNGILQYDENEKKFLPAQFDKATEKILSDQYIFRITFDSEKNLWLMSATDIFKYNFNVGTLSHLLNYSVANSINSGYEGELLEDEDGNMWAAHINLPGLYRFPGLSNNYIEHGSDRIYATDIMIDSFGIMWIGDWYEGLFKYDRSRQSFQKLQSKNFIQGRGVRAISASIDNPDLILISDDDAGWGTYNIITGKFKRLGKKPGINGFIPNKDGSIWMGFWGAGIQKWDPRTNRFKRFFADSTEFPDLPAGRILTMYRESEDTIWFGAVNGFFRMNNEGSKLEQIVYNHSVISFIFDGDIIWCTSYGEGLLKYNRTNGSRKYFKHDPKSNSISNNIVWDIHQDEQGILWLATQKGLNKFDPETEKFQIFLERDGLPNDHVGSILSDADGELWLGTLGGISHLQYDSTNQVIFSNYDAQDGLANASFRHPISFKDSGNRLYFGGEGGMYWFTPVKKHSQPPVTYITDISVNGISVINGDYDNHNKNENYVGTFELNYDQNNLEFNFIGLHFAQPIKNRYAYFLEGHDDDWISDTERRAAYVNLDPGNYTFRVKALNNEGVWSSESPSIFVKINQPWWNTWYSYTAYIVVFFGFLLGVRRFELNRRKEIEKKRLLEAENQRKTDELEEARQLQLSMLPKQIPQLPNLDIAVYMKTATEVGGDYYDFHIGMDGTLTVVIGDATGHGMKAGTMVTTTKSLFRVLAPNPDVTGTFNEMTKCIKEMDMPKLSMCMTLAKFTNDTLRIATAGMPPAYYFNSKSGEIDELLTEGMPLGTFSDFPYETKEVSLASGDTILLLSDGMPELMNENGEMFGYERVSKKFGEIKNYDPEKIIDELKDTASEWVNDKDPGDDVTFVVIKVK